MEQIKPMDFCSGQGANHSNSTAIARICNAVMDEKTRFYVPDSVKHHTSGLKDSSILISLRTAQMLSQGALPRRIVPCVKHPKVAW